MNRQPIQFDRGDTSVTHTIYIRQDDICEEDPLERFFSNIVLENGQRVRVTREQAIVYIDDSQEPECGKTKRMIHMHVFKNCS